MNILDAVILGIVEGLTEFLPVSSTGHLILTSHLLGLSGDKINSFEVFIQLGAILAVVVLYRRRFRMLFDFRSSQGFQPGQFSGLYGWLLLAVTSFPAALVGLLTDDLIETYLFSWNTVIWALLIGGLFLILFERWLRQPRTFNLDQLTLKQAFWIGVAQCFSLWPGVSRAGATIAGAMVAGLDRRTAAEYSFMAAVPIMLMATLYKLAKIYHALSPQDLWVFAVGFMVAFASALVAVRLFIHWVQRVTFVGFGVYRIALALLWLAVMGGWIFH